ncbi:MAG: bifunctional oligoribonuclease/PAP phosphatase NrnA, partial [Elusimicrobia bacterium]|nr:bifunctional oligoribonuclease/PAP phosphatase NrnA [Elusimicrobiota bacterium]
MKKISSQTILKRIAGIIRKNKTFFLAGHINPDGDTLGSCLALASVLKRLGKKATVFVVGAVPQNLGFLPGINEVQTQINPQASYDAGILMECSNLERTGSILDFKRQIKTLVNIDHHKTSTPYAHVNLIEPKSASNAELVYRVINALQVKMKKEEAMCLYVGIATDTGRFHYSNTTPETLETVADLLRLGVPASSINDRLFATKPLPALKLLGKCLTTLSLEHHGTICIQTIDHKTLEECGALMEHSDDIVNYGLMIPGVAASILIKEEKKDPPRVSVSLRARDTVDMSAVAEVFGGGG